MAINPDEASIRCLLLALNTTAAGAAAVVASVVAAAAKAQGSVPQSTSAQFNATFLDVGASAEDLLAILKQVSAHYLRHLHC